MLACPTRAPAAPTTVQSRGKLKSLHSVRSSEPSACTVARGSLCRKRDSIDNLTFAKLNEWQATRGPTQQSGARRSEKRAGSCSFGSQARLLAPPTYPPGKGSHAGEGPAGNRLLCTAIRQNQNQSESQPPRITSPPTARIVRSYHWRESPSAGLKPLHAVHPIPANIAIVLIHQIAP